MQASNTFDNLFLNTEKERKRTGIKAICNKDKQESILKLLNCLFLSFLCSVNGTPVKDN